jgi:hypothetical protein
LEGNRENPMDGEVRVMCAAMSSVGVGSSHTVHLVSPAGMGFQGHGRLPQTRRERLIAGALQAVSEGSVDGLVQTRDTC